MFKRIVVPLDGSPFSENALPIAEEMAHLTGAPVQLVRVLDIARLLRYSAADVTVEDPAWAEVMDDEETAAREELDRAERAVRESGLTATSEIRRGDVVQELLAAARPGDLVVMASHGRGGLARWFLGSVAEAVIRRSEVPVLLVRAPHADAQVQPQPAEGRGGG